VGREKRKKGKIHKKEMKRGKRKEKKDNHLTVGGKSCPSAKGVTEWVESIGIWRKRKRGKLMTRYRKSCKGTRVEEATKNPTKKRHQKDDATVVLESGQICKKGGKFWQW